MYLIRNLRIYIYLKNYNIYRLLLKRIFSCFIKLVIPNMIKILYYTPLHIKKRLLKYYNLIIYITTIQKFYFKITLSSS